MSTGGHVDGLLFDLVAGTLSAAERASTLAHLEGCESCRREHAATEALFAGLALEMAPVEPPPALRARVLASLEHGGRFEDFAERVAGLLDIAVDRARALLDRLDDPAAWGPLFAGYRLIRPEVGPRLTGATVGVLRIRPGARFPLHSHGGPEQVLFLQGGIFDDTDGRAWHAGELQERPAGSPHTYRGLPGLDCLCIGVILGSLDLLEQPAEEE